MGGRVGDSVLNVSCLVPCCVRDYECVRIRRDYKTAHADGMSCISLIFVLDSWSKYTAFGRLREDLMNYGDVLRVIVYIVLPRPGQDCQCDNRSFYRVSIKSFSPVVKAIVEIIQPIRS